jgi:Pectate lyase superfamily protein/Major tropism determinant N-terminal domain
MAVYQISKIQIRRGNARTGPGFPQLASGELGWAVDSQQLYIGNGSIAEGAPTVGNTKILTERDILSGGSGLISTLEHTYKSSDATITTGVSTNAPVIRSLQTILDDSVSVYDFGAVGNGAVNDTAAIQRAITQLFANFNLKSFLTTQEGVKRRVVLQMPPGIFVINGTLSIPSYTTIIGAGVDKTIIQYTGLGTAIRCTADSDSPYPVINPRYIRLQGLTIQSVEVATNGLDIANTTNSVFQDIKLVSNWSLGTAIDNKAINIDSLASTTADNVVFNNITINNYYYGVYAGNESTHITFNNGLISTAYIGFALGVDLDNTSNGPSNYHVSNYKFNNVSKHAFVSIIGTNNSITNCDLTSVGGSNSAPLTPQIYFDQPGNYSSDIRSDRSIVLADPTSSVSYIPEVSGSSVYTSTTKVVSIIVSPTSVDIIRIPLKTDNTGSVAGSMSYVVNYVFHGMFTRQGQISISVNSPNINTSEDYTCSTLTTSNAILLDFTVAIVDNSIVISYTNNFTDNAGTLTYSYTALS